MWLAWIQFLVPYMVLSIARITWLQSQNETFDTDEYGAQIKQKPSFIYGSILVTSDDAQDPLLALCSRVITFSPQGTTAVPGTESGLALCMVRALPTGL